MVKEVAGIKDFHSHLDKTMASLGKGLNGMEDQMVGSKQDI